MSIFKHTIGCIAISTLLLACSKDEKFDVKGNKEVKFFTNNIALGNAPQNSISFNVANRPSGSSLVNISNNLPEEIKFPVLATRPVADEVTIQAELDNSLIAAYNQKHGTNYQAFPDGFITSNNYTARISKDMDFSIDSISVPVNKVNVTALAANAYMAPIRLKSVSNEKLGVITGVEGSNVTYIVVNPEIRYIEYNSGAAAMTGTLINPRSGWTVSFNPAPIQTGNVTDGSNSTFSRWGVSLVEANINLNETKNVTGFRIYTASSATYSPTQVNVEVSNDGITYRSLGMPLRANLTTASGYTYIKLYEAISTSYVRLVVSYSTSTNTNNRRIAELDVYAN